MRQGTSSGHFFETDATQALNAKRAAKADNKYGNPIKLKSKLLAAIPDPASPSSVLVAESAGCVRRVNVDTGDTKQVYRGPTAPVTCVAVGGPRNRTLFAGSWDQAIWSWDLETRAPGIKFSGHTDFVKAVVCATISGKACLISGGADKKIMVWDAETGRRLHVLQDHVVPMMAVQALALDPFPPESAGGDSSSSSSSVILVSASSDPHVRRWRVGLDGFEQLKEASSSPDEPAAARHSLLEHDTTVYRLAFDHDGDDDDDEESVDLWTASGDGTAKCLARRRGFAADDTLEHGDHVRALALAGGGGWVLTAGRDEDIKVWSRATADVYCVLEGHYDEVTDIAVLPPAAAAAAGAAQKKKQQRVVSVSIDGTVRTWDLATEELDRINKEREEREKRTTEGDDDGEEEEEKVEGGMTAEEEAELAALMEDD